MIKTPDILPNNLREVREWKNKDTEETAIALGVNRSYISILENSRANMSSSLALSIMDYLDCTFAQLFDMNKVMSLEFSTEKYSERITKIIVNEKELTDFHNDNIIDVVKMLEKELSQYNLPGQIHKIEEISSEEITPEKILLTIRVIIVDTVTEVLDFDLNISEDMNVDLYKTLQKRGFEEEELFSVHFIEEYLGISREDTQRAIGLSEEGYYEVLSGEKRIPVKIMWRLVKYFKVPLEYIMNVELYRNKITPIDL